MIKNKQIRYFKLIIIFLLSLSIFSGCTTNFLSLKPPKVEITDIKLMNASFEKIDIALNVKVSNSYPFSASLPGFDYDLKINNSTFIKGDKELNQNINAFSDSIVEIPVSVNFFELYNTYKSLKNSNKSIYNLSGSIHVLVPILGKIKIPYEKQGELPLFKIPKIKIEGLRLQRINLAGADLNLEIKINNSNAFSLLLNSFSYNLQINGMSWAIGNSNKPVSINEQNESVINIPIKLNFFKIGRSAYTLLSGNNDMNYEFTSDFDLDTSIPLLKNVKFPIKRSGSINIIR